MHGAAVPSSLQARPNSSLEHESAICTGEQPASLAALPFAITPLKEVYNVFQDWGKEECLA